MDGIVPGLLLATATPDDVALIHQFVRELAAFEKLSHEVVASEADLHAALFGPTSCIETVIAQYEGEPAGFALFYTTFSTFLGKPGLYLEDLFVRPDYRGRGIGRALLAHLAQLVQARGYARLEWTVLDWNEPAIGFYRRLGAVPLDGWRINRLEGAALAALANTSAR